MIKRTSAVNPSAWSGSLFAAVAAAMGLDMAFRPADRGPWLYRERRVSRGREFELLKFRTLCREVLEAATEDEAHARLHEADPGNLTWSGRRFLKPWYLDELPQLWNVVRGDMSLVGPRPSHAVIVDSPLPGGLTVHQQVHEALAPQRASARGRCIRLAGRRLPARSLASSGRSGRA